MGMDAITGRTGPLGRLRDWLPRGQTLPDDVWLRRHHTMVGLLIAQGIGLAIFGLFQGYGVLHTMAHVAIIAPVAIAALAFEQHRRWAAVLVAVGLATESALLVHIWHGAIEAHFMFFVMIVVLALYEDWLPFLVAAAYVLIHHGVVGALDPSAVYNHGDAVDHPWKWAAIHAVFVIAAGFAALVAWRENERMRDEARKVHEMAAESEERFRLGFESAPIGMAISTLDPRQPELIQVNEALCRMTGRPEKELLGSDFRKLLHPDDLPAVERAIMEYLGRNERSTELETRFINPDGQVLWAVLAIASLPTPEGDSQLAIAQIQDVTEEKLSAERLSYEARHDALTGLPNRRSLVEDLEERVSKASADRPIPLLLCDLDGFKAYNDTFGHPAGDALLRRVGKRLSKAVKNSGTAYRMGGDEFCVLARDGSADMDEIIVAATEALTIKGDSFTVSSSLGSVMLPTEAATASEALGTADRRMYTNKRSARSSPGRQSADVLLQILTERDPALGNHLDDVTALCEAVAVRLEMRDDELGPLLQAASLHDVGKAAIPDEILMKDGPLDVDEWALMRQHTLIGERILDAAPALSRAAKLVRWSHERWDGHGYPDAISGEKIPLGARIIAVCDAYDAMTAGRPYRKAMTASAALSELQRCAGEQFDPAVVKAFAAALSESHDRGVLTP
jgi:diguanylate cyclase (GGDEF)-like protein/PAS domain S-box-containing protein